jgi:hypothetical protein
VLDAARHLDEAMKLSTPLLASAQGKFYFTLLDGSDVTLALLDRLGALKRREADICEKFTAIPHVDYIGAKTKIESLNTQLLAERIDGRLIEFYDHNKNTALTLGKIIRESSVSRSTSSPTSNALFRASSPDCVIMLSSSRCSANSSTS